MPIEQADTRRSRQSGMTLPVAMMLGLSVSVWAEPVPTRAIDDELPDEEFLLFLAEAVEVDGELVDPLVLLEQQQHSGAVNVAGELTTGGQGDE